MTLKQDPNTGGGVGEKKTNQHWGKHIPYPTGEQASFPNERQCEHFAKTYKLKIT